MCFLSARDRLASLGSSLVTVLSSPQSLSLLESNMADDLDDEWWLEDKDVEDTGKFCLVNHPAFFLKRTYNA